MSNIQLSPRMYSIDDIFRLLKNKEIEIQPKYQRRRTSWPITAKTSLIDTIINNYPIQPIYLREYYNDNNNRIKEVIDGQQRISTIVEFLNDRYELGENFTESEYIGYKYYELPLDLKKAINNYELSFLSIRGATEADIVTIFSRINSFTLPLNPQEKRNAIWSGQLKTLIYHLASVYSKFWNEYSIFSDAAIARMKEAQFISEVIFIIDKGFNKYNINLIDKLYKEYDTKFHQNENYLNLFHNIMSIIGNLFEEDLIHKHFRRQAWFLTLFLAIVEKLYFKPGAKKKSFTPNALDLDKLRVSLLKIIVDYKTEKFPEDIVLLYRQGTGSGINRENRHNHLLSLL